MKEGVIVGTPGEKQQQAKTTGAKMSYFYEFLKKKKKWSCDLRVWKIEKYYILTYEMT